MDKKNKIALGAVAAVIALGAATVWFYNHYQAREEEKSLNGNTPIATAGVPSPSTTTPASAANADSNSGLATDVGSPSVSYGQAVNIYGKTRIQFDANCRMLPTDPVFKNGTTVMFDNRYRDGRYFKLDGVRYYLPGYGFKLLKLTAQKLPHVIDVDCGNGQNNGKIRLQ